MSVGKNIFNPPLFNPQSIKTKVPVSDRKPLIAIVQMQVVNSFIHPRMKPIISGRFIKATLEKLSI